MSQTEEEMFQMSLIAPLGIKPLSIKSQRIRIIDEYIASLTMERNRLINMTEEDVIEEELEKDERKTLQKISKKLSPKEPKVKPIKEPKVKPIKEPKIKPIKPKRRRATKAEMRARQEKLVEEFMKEAEKYLA
jgi:hypothetical protein